MPEASPTLRAMQAATLVIATGAGAANMGLSLFVIPRLLESPTPLMLRQWNNMYNRTSRAFPPPMILSGFAYFYLAYATRNLFPVRSRWYALAGTLCAIVTPWTWNIIFPINRKLLKKAEDVRGVGIVAVTMTAEEEEGAKRLVDNWGIYNLPRGAAVFLAGVIGVFATVF